MVLGNTTASIVYCILLNVAEMWVNGSKQV